MDRFQETANLLGISYPTASDIQREHKSFDLYLHDVMQVINRCTVVPNKMDRECRKVVDLFSAMSSSPRVVAHLLIAPSCC